MGVQADLYRCPGIDKTQFPTVDRALGIFPLLYGRLSARTGLLGYDLLTAFKFLPRAPTLAAMDPLLHTWLEVLVASYSKLPYEYSHRHLS